MIRSHVHTIPLSDSDRHILTAACPCFPCIEAHMRDGIVTLALKHTAFDRREEAKKIGVGDSKGWSNMDEHGDTFEDHEEQSALRPLEDDAE